MRRHQLGACLAIGVLLLTWNVVQAAEATLTGASSQRAGHVLSVSFKVEGAFTPKMEEAILSGIPQTFTYFFEVYRVVNAWPDQRIYNWQVRRTIKYDTLKKAFTVTLGSNEKDRQTKDLSEAKKWLTEFQGFPVAVVPALQADASHYVRVKAELDPVDWPLYLNRIFFFANLWDFKTPWLRIELPDGVSDDTPTNQPE
ncbi:MAG: DUF4390 domain-containing protein [Candidatus Lernaella stagnicola]|nr:DUF4390 domain-containing protein [Candidatus Lernaella stagnicola]